MALTLDAGALIAVVRGDVRVRALLRSGHERGGVRVPAPVLAQVWRHPSQQVRLARLLKTGQVDLVPMTAVTARAAGLLCGATGTSDVVDAVVAVVALEHEDFVVTSDPDDLVRLLGRDRVVAV